MCTHSQENPLRKFVGVCNEAKRSLDACFRREKEFKRKVNFAKAEEERKRLQKRREKA